MGLIPKDSEGRTAWDYAAGIWRELCAIKDALTDSGEEAITRFLSAQPPAFAGGVLTTQATFQVPPGSRWEAMMVSARKGDATAGRIRIYRNVMEDSGFIGALFFSLGDTSVVPLPPNLVLEENTQLIVQVVTDAAADGTQPTVNVVCRQVNYGPPPMPVREQGENLMAAGFAPIDPDEEREESVDYATNGRG